MKPLLYISLVFLVLSGCSRYYEMPPALHPNPSAAQDLFATPTYTPETTLTTVNSPVPSSLQRGINLGNMLEAPREGDWGLRVQEDYFDRIKEAGFDFVRLPVRWSTHAQQSTPYAIDPAFFVRVDEVVNWALERDLAIIVDFHHYEEIMPKPRENEERYLDIWKQVAEHYQYFSPKVLFELLNEPNGHLDASLWNQYLREALSVIRETNPTRDVVIGPVNWNAYNWLTTLDVPEDKHIIVTFHYYLPFQFTHQGASWVEGSGPWLGTPWDATEVEKAEITRHFDAVSAWSQRHHNVRILLGEFGAYSKAEMASRVHWTDYVRSEAERHGFAWAYWEFAAGFGIYDPQAKVWRKDLLKALIP